MKEQEAYELVKPTICKVLQRNFLPEDYLTFEEKKGYWSIGYDGALIARVHFGHKLSFFSVSSAVKGALDSAEIAYDIKPGDTGFARILLGCPDDLIPAMDCIAAAAQLALDAIPKEFDCCSRVEKCSDALSCIQPFPDLRKACGYRKILASGCVFYGKNRNID